MLGSRRGNVMSLLLLTVQANAPIPPIPDGDAIGPVNTVGVNSTMAVNGTATNRPVFNIIQGGEMCIPFEFRAMDVAWENRYMEIPTRSKCI